MRASVSKPASGVRGVAHQEGDQRRDRGAISVAREPESAGRLQALADQSPQQSVLAQLQSLVDSSRGARTRAGNGLAQAHQGPPVQRMSTEEAEALLKGQDIPLHDTLVAKVAEWVTEAESGLDPDATIVFHANLGVALMMVGLEPPEGGTEGLEAGIRTAIAEALQPDPPAAAAAPPLSLAEPPWAAATGVEVKSSGNGGIVIVRFAGGTLVVKGTGTGAEREVLASRMARSVGLDAPETREVKSGEAEEILAVLARFGREMPNRPREAGGGRVPTLVMEHIDGEDLGGERREEPDPATVAALAFSIGNWLAFDILIAEQDRFGQLKTGAYGEDRMVNSANLLVAGPAGTRLAGIDQAVTRGARADKVRMALAGDDRLYDNAAGALLDALQINSSSEALIGSVRAGAEETFRRMAGSLDEARILELAAGLGVSGEIIDRLLSTLREIAGTFGE